MAKKTAKLGHQLLDMIDQMTELLAKATNPDSVRQLVIQQLKLRQQAADLIDARLDQASQEYQEASEGLQAASATIQKALKDMETVVAAIQTIARAVELVSRLL